MIDATRGHIVREKEALRNHFQAYRKHLSPAEYTTLSASIVARAKMLPELAHAETIHTYWPVLNQREVDHRALIYWLHHAGKQIVLPVVVTFTRTPTEQPRLRHVPFASDDTLRLNQWGIREPSGGKSVPIETMDAVIVPALGAGRNGHRIGHGYGYYDELLQRFHVPKIGLVYAACLVDSVPAEPHDVPLDVLLTEDEVIRPAPDVTS
ncbi:MAG: 5-formyltetrahydrofolate cyclo-ligase [Rhodothermales bacterium]